MTMFQEQNRFETRSGRTIKIGRDGSLIFDHVNGYLGPDSAFDAEEYFQAKHDLDLGWWRWAVNPHVVAWASRRSNEKDVTVLDEEIGYVGYFTRAEVEDVRPGEGLIRAGARAYFEAHPEPTLWAGAKFGEIWAVTIHDVEQACTVVDPQRTEGDIAFLPITRFGSATWFIPSSHTVSAARKLWGPEA